MPDPGNTTPSSQAAVSRSGWRQRLPFGRLGANTVLTTAGLGTRAVLQAGYLILLSRAMGPSGYGLFAGSVAAAILLSPLSGWGASYILTERIAGDRRQAPALWASALVQVGLSSFALIALVMAVSVWFLDARVGLGAMLLLALAELAALPAAQVAATLLLVNERGRAAAVAVCLVPLGRVLAVAGWLASGGSAEPGSIALMHFIGTLAGLATVLWLVHRDIGAPAWRERTRAAEMTGAGMHYAAGFMVGSSYQEVDKILLLQILGAAMAGMYTAAFRVIAVLLIPVSSLTATALPRLFAAKDWQQRWTLLRAMTVASVGYAALACVLGVLCAPLMPVIFGAGFSESTGYLSMLAPWILLYAVRQPAAAALTASGMQKRRVIIEFAGMALVCGLNLALLRPLGAVGAAMSLLAAEAAMAVACWWTLRAHARGAGGAQHPQTT